jgi:hypothetical protein
MKTRSVFWLVVSIGIASGCGGGGGGGSPASDTTLQPPTYSVAGDWLITETAKPNNCPKQASLESFTLSVEHSDGSNTVKVTAHDTGVTYDGTVSATNVAYSGSVANADCPVGQSLSVALTMTSATSFTGNAQWTCNYNGGSCSGTTSFIGTKSGGSTDSIPPSVPDSLTAKSLGRSISLAWTESTDNVGVAGYGVERCQGSGCTNFLPIGTTNAASAVDYDDRNLLASTTYRYRVRAKDAANNWSAYSNLVQTTTQEAPGDTVSPTTPTGLVATAVTTTQILLSWNAATDNVGVSTYKVYQDDDYPITPLVFKAYVTSPTVVITVPPASRSCYRVAARDAAGNESSLSNQACATTPIAPAATTVTLYSAKDANIIWSDASATFAITNYGASGTLGIGNNFLDGAFIDSTMKQVALIDFSFDPAFWLNKPIVSAKLRLYVYASAVQQDGVYRVLKIDDSLSDGHLRYPWVETGISGVTWNSAPNVVLNPNSTSTAPGTGNDYTEWDVTAIVREWFATTTLGNGFAIYDMTAPSVSRTDDQITRYYSRETRVESLRPRLIITY